MEAKKDPMGYAIYQSWQKKKGKLIVSSSMFDDDEIPTDILMREYKDMPKVEQKAISYISKASKDRFVNILDVGAGSGTHSLELCKRCPNANIHAIDISPYSVMTMRERGLENVDCIDFFALRSQNGDSLKSYDFIIMLMNGSGIIGKVSRMAEFFQTLDKILKPGGELILDSSDLRYLYEDEDGSFLIDLNDDYYGEVDFQMEYRAQDGTKVTGDSFDWLYVDIDTLIYYALQHGYTVEKLIDGENYHYLAKIYKKQ